MVKNNNLQNWNQESRSLPSPAKKVSECLREHIRVAASANNYESRIQKLLIIN